MYKNIYVCTQRHNFYLDLWYEFIIYYEEATLLCKYEPLRAPALRSATISRKNVIGVYVLVYYLQ